MNGDRGDHERAHALALAFLAAEWQPDAMAIHGERAIAGWFPIDQPQHAEQDDSETARRERRHQWLRALARAVTDAYPQPPLDRPRELGSFIAAHDKLTAAQRADARLGHRPVAPSLWHPPGLRMAPRRWPVPDVPDVTALAEFLAVTPAELAWFADTRQMQRRTRPHPLHHYDHWWLTRNRSGKPRLIERPKPRLRALQRIILDTVLAPIPLPDAVHGFARGRSAITAASLHAGSSLVISLDIESFFASITVTRIYGLFRSAGYAEAVAHVLAGLCTVATPVAAITSMPSGGDADARHRLRAHLRRPHLPQGAPTSPALANLAATRLDRRIAGYAEKLELRYTRYADDLTLSGPATTPVPRLVAAIRHIVSEEGFRLNDAKTRAGTNAQRQLVTGVVVNAHPNVARTEYDRLKALLHNAKAHGAQTQNRDNHPDFAAHVRGRVAWVHAVNPQRGRKLLELFDAIDW